MIDFWIIKRVGGAGLCLVGWFGWRLPELLTHDAGTPPPPGSRSVGQYLVSCQLVSYRTNVTGLYDKS